MFQREDCVEQPDQTYVCGSSKHGTIQTVVMLTSTILTQGPQSARSYSAKHCSAYRGTNRHSAQSNHEPLFEMWGLRVVWLVSKNAEKDAMLVYFVESTHIPAGISYDD